MSDIQVVMNPRVGVGELIESYLDKKIVYDELCAKVAALGYRTTSLYEMVRGAEQERASREPKYCSARATLGLAYRFPVDQCPHCSTACRGYLR